MADLVFPSHALDEMANNNITLDDVYQVVGDADQMIERDDGRTEFSGVRGGRFIVVVIEDDGATVVTAWHDKRRYRRRRWN